MDFYYSRFFRWSTIQCLHMCAIYALSPILIIGVCLVHLCVSSVCTPFPKFPNQIALANGSCCRLFRMHIYIYIYQALILRRCSVQPSRLFAATKHTHNICICGKILPSTIPQSTTFYVLKYILESKPCWLHVT